MPGGCQWPSALVLEVDATVSLTGVRARFFLHAAIHENPYMKFITF